MSLVHRKLNRKPDEDATPRKGVRAGREPLDVRRQYQALQEIVQQRDALIESLRSELRTLEHVVGERVREQAEQQRLATEREALLRAQVVELKRRLDRATCGNPAAGRGPTSGRAGEEDSRGGSLLSEARRLR